MTEFVSARPAVQPEDFRVTRMRLHQPREDFHRRRFARAVLAEEREHRAFRHGEGKPVDCGLSAIPHQQFFDDYRIAVDHGRPFRVRELTGVAVAGGVQPRPFVFDHFAKVDCRQPRRSRLAQCLAQPE